MVGSTCEVRLASLNFTIVPLTFSLHGSAVVTKQSFSAIFLKGGKASHNRLSMPFGDIQIYHLLC